MNKTSRLIQRLAIALLTLLLGGGALTLWAQQEQQEPIKPIPPERQETIVPVPPERQETIEPVPPEQQEPSETVPPEQQEPSETVPPEQQETQDAENTAATTIEETDADNSPFEYQSSEKISEDLSVSFPVDI